MKEKKTIQNKKLIFTNQKKRIKEGKDELQMTAVSEGSQLRKLIHFFQSGSPSV